MCVYVIVCVWEREKKERVCVFKRERARDKKIIRKREWVDESVEGAALSLASAWGYGKKSTNGFFLKERKKERKKDWFQHPQYLDR